MFKTKENCDYQVIKNMKGGEGEFRLQHIISKDEFFGHGRLFAKGILPPGSSVGFHEHNGDMEVCYFLEGSGKVIDDGKEYHVNPGDVNVVYGGKGHEIVNDGDKDLVYMVLVLFTE